MDLSLALAAVLMGLAGSLHCSVMCGAACSAIGQRCSAGSPGRALLGFHLGRVASYAAAGAVAAASVSALGHWAQAAPALRPIWSLVHASALMLGLWLVWTGRQPAWLAAWGQTVQAPRALAGAWQPIRGPLTAAASGGAWALLPCGLLQSALLGAALASSPLAGAAVMAGFALASSLGLLAVGVVWQRNVAAPEAMRWAVRLAGAMLAGASAWALGHGLWRQVLDYCLS